MDGKNKTTIKKLTLTAILSAMLVVGRIAFMSIPNFQPMTAILIIITIYMGINVGLLHVFIGVTVSNFLLGTGLWNIAQMFSWGIIVLITGLFSKILKQWETIGIVFSFLSGLIYGFVISLFYYIFLDIGGFIVYYTSGIPYDLMHAIGNAMFFFVLNKPLKNIIKKYKK